ncbi:DUF3240 family protein [Methylomonas sp. BW4-1]|uniref:DUF3240 family protein n=2 Tax=Methylomonas TaxID=416 RepID=A0ABU4UG94_9GAMM|nr:MULTISPECIES: DUF3240 family protein [Methylomonas]MBD9359773.1 DUF3240 family protein [Methylomonas fluvii]MDX8127840.1 DUF3240 family protein [Methylomonas sp. OY6]PKD40170.1 DUF3240 domain-containing protein [Methylomonas sp. Kb3]QSB01511.1 DUF3240 family protein [Methylomonas sp. EFPC1]
MSHEAFLLTVNVPPSLEEALVDCLLSLEWSQGFTSFPANVHDHNQQGLSLAEQVAGHQRKIRFQMYVERQNISALLTKLKADFTGSGLHYWLVPAIEQGII